MTTTPAAEQLPTPKVIWADNMVRPVAMVDLVADGTEFAEFAYIGGEWYSISLPMTRAEMDRPWEFRHQNGGRLPVTPEAAAELTAQTCKLLRVDSI